MSNTVLNSETAWYAVRTKPMEEERAALNLISWQVPIFAPKLKERRTGYGSPFVTKPLFANYIFARFNPDRQLHKINYTRGVQNVVSFGGLPIPIDEEVIDVIRERIGDDGFIHTDEEDLKPGDRVRINSGPFEDLVGVFKQSTRDKERVKILLDAMKCQSHILINRECVEKV